MDEADTLPHDGPAMLYQRLRQPRLSLVNRQQEGNVRVERTVGRALDENKKETTCILMFNGAGFSHQICKLAGVEGPIDGHLVKAILCGRVDVEILSGGSHYRLIESKS